MHKQGLEFGNPLVFCVWRVNPVKISPYNCNHILLNYVDKCIACTSVPVSVKIPWMIWLNGSFSPITPWPYNHSCFDHSVLYELVGWYFYPYPYLWFVRILSSGSSKITYNYILANRDMLSIEIGFANASDNNHSDWECNVPIPRVIWALYGQLVFLSVGVGVRLSINKAAVDSGYLGQRLETMLTFDRRFLLNTSSCGPFY